MKDLMKDRLGNFVHNCIAHPLMFILPKKWGDSFHDWTIRVVWSSAKYEKE